MLPYGRCRFIRLLIRNRLFYPSAVAARAIVSPENVDKLILDGKERGGREGASERVSEGARREEDRMRKTDKG